MIEKRFRTLQMDLKKTSSLFKLINQLFILNLTVWGELLRVTQNAKNYFAESRKLIENKWLIDS